jgi:hypothetical protein
MDRPVLVPAPTAHHHAATDAPLPHSDPTDNQTQTPTPSERRSRRKDEATPIQIALQHSAELRNAAWAEPLEARILGQLSQSTGLAVGSVEADCRQFTCRIRLVYPQGGRGSPSQLNTLLTTLGFEPRIDFIFGEVDGLPVTTAYLRSNQQPPLD